MFNRDQFLRKESLDRLIHWLEIDLKPDQKWEVSQDRVRAQGLLSLSSRKVCNFKRALIDWDEQTGDEAERCTSGVATKREGSPLPIRAMQEADHPEAASKDLVDSFQKKPQQLDEARPEALSKNRFRRIQRKCH